MSYYKNSPPSTLSSNHQGITSCYFCNENMDPKYMPEHIAHCGAVLEECPEKCGAYVPRNELREHQTQCFRALNGKVQRTSACIDERIRSLQESAWKNKIVSILGLLKNAVHEGENEIKELRDTLASSLQLTNEALRKDILEELFENRKTISTITSRLNSLENSYADLQYRSVQNFQQTSAELEKLKLETANEQHRSMEEREKCFAVLEEMKADFTAESATICKLWQEQVQNIHDMKLELEMRCKLSKELVDKYNVMFDKIEALECRMQKYREEVDEQAKNCKTLKFQMKENVKYVEDLLRDLQINGIDNGYPYDCGCKNENMSIGRLIWRIDHYKEKMDNAKRNDTVIFSPTFYDKEYGYTLRMELYLNGLGHWKNRHVIGCLRIVDGKWDPLLEWPCVLTADVILRDQENFGNDVEKFVKTVKKGKTNEDLDHNSDLYMFIPHTTLSRHSGYTKENVMFLEIRVRDQKFRGSTLSLV